MPLTYKGFSVMKKTRESSNAQIGLVEKQNLVACLAAMGATHIEITMLAQANADLISHGFTPSPLSIEAETQEWYDVIHAQANVYGNSVFGGRLKVYDRAVFPGIEGILGYSYDTGTPVGTAASSATDGETTWCGRYRRYLVSNVTAAKMKTGDIQCPVPEITAQAFGGNFFTSQSGAITFVQQAHLIATEIYASVGKTCVFLNNPNFSETASGWWGGGAYSDTGIVCYDYYGGYNGTSLVTPAGYSRDVDEVYAGRNPETGGFIPTAGYPQFFGEWGDLSGSILLAKGVRTGDNFVVGTTQLEDWMHYWVQFLKMLKVQADAGKVIGFNYWGGWENQNTSVLYKTGSGAGSQYFPNWRGQMLANYFKGNIVTPRPPQITAGTFTEADPSFGGRNMHF